MYGKGYNKSKSKFNKSKSKSNKSKFNETSAGELFDICAIYSGGPMVDPYKLTEDDIKLIKQAMIEDGLKPDDMYLTEISENSLYGCNPPLSNTMYVMRERNIIPVKTHEVCIMIDNNHSR